MNHLCFVAVAVGLFLVTTISAEAQANINLEKYAAKSKASKSPKFIDDIELNPEATAVNMPVAQEKTTAAVSVRKTVNVSNPAADIEHLNALQFKYALMMNREVESLTNVQLYKFIDDWWGIRYRYGGDTRKGIDCSAFTSHLLNTVYGVESPRTAQDQYDACEKIALLELVEGDLVFFDTKGGVSHVGLYLGNNYFVHSATHGGVSISSLNEDYYSRKFISGGRIAVK